VGWGELAGLLEALVAKVKWVKEYTYDASSGQLLTLTQVGDDVTEEAMTIYEYDGFGNLTKLINAEGHETEYQNHDAMGKAWTVIDGRDKVWSYTYDAHGNMTSTTTPLQHTTSQEYDKVGNRVKVIYPDTNFMEYEYDGLNRLVKQINELRHELVYEYDLAGNLIKETDQVSRSIEYTFDLLNRLVSTNDAAGNHVYYHYPNTSDLSSFNIYQPKKIIYPTYSTQSKFDLRGRLIEETKEFLSDQIQKTEVMKFKYDLAGNQIEVIDAELRSLQSSYNELNQLIQTTEPTGVETNYSYDDRGNLLTLTDGLQQTHEFSYDRLDQVLSEKRPLGQTHIYTYDPNENQATGIDAKGQLVKYTYDDDNRKTKEEFHTTSGVLDKTVIYQYTMRNNLVAYDDGL